MCGGRCSPLLSAFTLALPQSPIVKVEPGNSRWVQLVCWYCQSSVNADFTWCPICGSALKPVACSYCGQMIGIQDDHCPHCGAPKKVITQN